MLFRYDHFCFVGMGDHYLQFDYTPDQVFLLDYRILVCNVHAFKHYNPAPSPQFLFKDKIFLQACDSVLPFQILYDQGVITGFVWQVTTSCVTLVLSSLPAFHVEHVFESISEDQQFCKNMFCSTLPPCPETSGSILMPWPSLPSLTGWSPQSPVGTHHSHQRGGRGSTLLYYISQVIWV